jgi:hypothetical protein
VSTIVPSREAKLPPSLVDRRASRAFRASVGIHGTAPWNCDRGMHEPAFVGSAWECARCRNLLSATDQVPPTVPIARLGDLVTVYPGDLLATGDGVIFDGPRRSMRAGRVSL